MTKIIFHDNNASIGSRSMNNKEALVLLETLKTTDTFEFNNVLLAYTESYVSIPTSKSDHVRIYVYGEVVIGG